jgi:hypothetical protein
MPKELESILNLVKKQPLHEIVARLAAKDGFIIRAITGTNSIREYITQNGFILPKNLSKTMILILIETPVYYPNHVTIKVTY